MKFGLRGIAFCTASMTIVIFIVFIIQSKIYFNDFSYKYIHEIASKNAFTTEDSLSDILEKISNSIRLTEHVDYIVSSNGSYNYNKLLNELKLASFKEHFNAKRIAIIDHQGNAITNDGLSNNLSHREFFKTSIKGYETISHVIEDTWSGADIVVFSSPIYFRGDIVGVAAIAFDNYIISRLIGQHDGVEESYFYIKQHDSKLIVSPTKMPNLLDLKQFLVKEMPEGYPDVVNFENKNYYILSKKIKFNDWVVVSVIPESMLPSWYNYLLKVSSYFFLALLLIILFTYFVFYEFKHGSINQVLNVNSLTKLPKFNSISSYPDFFYSKKNSFNFVLSVGVNNFEYIKMTLNKDDVDLMLINVCDLFLIHMGSSFRLHHNNDDDFIVFLSIEEIDMIYTIIEKINHEANTFPNSYKLIFGICQVESFEINVGEIVSKAIIARNIENNSSTSRGYKVFTSKMLDSIVKEAEIESLMYDALKNEEFVFYLQPKVCLLSNKVVGAEALIRWHSKKLSVVNPSDFIPVFEKNGYIKNVDLFIINKVCLFLSFLSRHQVWNLVPISVNLSRSYMFEPDFFNCLEQCIKKHNVEPSLIELEITESAIQQVSDYDSFFELLLKFKRLGVKISLDDFGEGYSSLKVFSNLHFDIIKFDRVFFNDLKSRDIKVIGSFVKTAHDLGMKVVAEGIENSIQLNIIKNIGFDMVQGYYFCKPLPIENYLSFINDFNGIQQ